MDNSNGSQFMMMPSKELPDSSSIDSGVGSSSHGTNKEEEAQMVQTQNCVAVPNDNPMLTSEPVADEDNNDDLKQTLPAPTLKTYTMAVGEENIDPQRKRVLEFYANAQALCRADVSCSKSTTKLVPSRCCSARRMHDDSATSASRPEAAQDRLNRKHLETLARMEVLRRNKYLQEINCGLCSNMMCKSARGMNTSRGTSRSRLGAEPSQQQCETSRADWQRLTGDKIANFDAWRELQQQKLVATSGVTFRPQVCIAIIRSSPR